MKPKVTDGWKRLFASTVVLHLFLGVVLLVVSLAGAFGAHEGEPAPGDDVVAVFSDVLSAPILLARTLLPEAIAPGFGPLALLLNSLVWAAAVVGVVFWRRWRERRTRDVEPPR